MVSLTNSCSAGTSRSLQAGKKDKTDYTINKVVQALDILEQFREGVGEFSVIELSRRLAMKAGYVERLLATLESRNYIELNRATGGYRLGFKNLELAQTVVRQTDLHRVSHPVLVSIAGKCGETTAVAVLKRSCAVELDAVHSDKPVQVVPQVGLHLPVHCTAAGKALIASESDEALGRLLNGMSLGRYTQNTITSVENLRIELRRIAEKGYAVDDEELDQGVRSVAAAIRDHVGQVVGALVITGPCCRIDLHRLDSELGPLAQKGAREISTKLGFHQPELQRLDLQSLETESLVRCNPLPRADARKCKVIGKQRAMPGP